MKKNKEVDKELKKLAARIKSLRIKNRYTNYEYFAYDHNISRSQYGRYEQGENMRYLSLIKVLKSLGISVKDFFSEGFDD